MFQLENRREPSFGEKLGLGLGRASAQASTMIPQHFQQKAQGEQLSKALGVDVGGLSPELQKVFAEKILSRQSKGMSEAQQEKQKNIQTGLGTLQEMKGLLSSTGPSNYLQGLFPGETQKNRAKFAQMGRSLIPLVAAGVSIRNQQEFDEYRKIITDPNAQQSTIEGALEGLENLLRRQSTEEGGSEGEPKEAKEQPSQSGNIVRVKSPDGKVYLVPKDKVQAAMSAGGKVVR